MTTTSRWWRRVLVRVVAATELIARKCQASALHTRPQPIQPNNCDSLPAPYHAKTTLNPVLVLYIAALTASKLVVYGKCTFFLNPKEWVI